MRSTPPWPILFMLGSSTIALFVVLHFHAPRHITYIVCGGTILSWLIAIVAGVAFALGRPRPRD